MMFGVRDPGGAGLRHLAGLSEMRLKGLDEDDSRALLESVVPGPLDEGVRDRIVAETRGNPLALLELPQGLAAGQLAGGFAMPVAANVPGQVQDVYGQRIAGLPDASRQLLLLAAAEPAAQARLLEIGARVRFRHPLVRSSRRASSWAPGWTACPTCRCGSPPGAARSRRR
jgi:hypothetical protein